MGTMNYLQKNTIYLCNYGTKDDIVWIGEQDYHGDAVDKQFIGQHYTSAETVYFRGTISLEDAVSRNLIKHDRFKRMGNVDKVNTVKAMLKLKGLPETLNFLAQTDLNLCIDDICSLSNCIK